MKVSEVHRAAVLYFFTALRKMNQIIIAPCFRHDPKVWQIMYVQVDIEYIHTAHAGFKKCVFFLLVFITRLKVTYFLCSKYQTPIIFSSTN